MTSPISSFSLFTVTNADELKRMIDDIADAGVVAFDTETRSKNLEKYPDGALRKMEMECDLASFAIPDKKAWVIPLGMVTRPCMDTDEFMASIKGLMEDNGILKKAWNFSFDAALYANYNVWVSGYEDVMVKAHALDENKGASLKERCEDGGMELTPFDFKTYWKMRESYRKRETDKKGNLKVHETDLAAHETRYIDYSAEDSIATIVLDPLYDAELAKYPKLLELYHRLLNPAVRTLFNMERRGVPINTTYFNVISKSCEEDCSRAEEDVYKIAGQHFNIGSTKDLGRVLYQELGLPVYKTTEKGASSTDSSTLQMLAMNGFKVAEYIMRYRHLSKLHSAFLDPSGGLAHAAYPWGCIHPSFNLTGTATGRLSCSNPNAQQIPRSSAKTYFIRKGFVPHKGYRMVGGDESQVELRMMAHFSADATMCNEYRKDAKLWEALNGRYSEEVIKALAQAKSDIHQSTADACKCKRNPTAKCVGGGTLIQLAKGSLVPIERIGAFGKVDAFTDLNVAIRAEDSAVQALQTYNGGKKRLYRVLARHGGLIATAEHKVVLENGTQVRVGDLKVGDVLRTACLSSLPNTRLTGHVEFRPMSACPVVRFPVSDALAYVAGLYVGDGIKCGRHSVGICHGNVHKTDPLGVPYAEWQQVMVDACTSAGLDCLARPNVVYLGSRATFRLFDALELIDGEDGPRALVVPSWVMTSRSAALQFLAGLFDTDGTVSDKGHACFTTKSFVLATQVATLVQTFGATPTIEPCWNKEYKRWYYRLHLPISHAYCLLRHMRHPGKLKRLRKRGFKSDVRYKANEVVLIEAEGVANCYDLHVDSRDHLYAANGIVTHNSINFGLLYGMMAKKLAATLTAVNFLNCLEKGIPFDPIADTVTPELAQEFYDLFFNKYPGIMAYQEAVGDKAQQQGFIETRWGRRRRLPDMFSGDRYLVMGARRQAVNTTIQGHVGEMMLLGMCKADNVIPNPDGEALKKIGYRLFLQVHDEVIGECPDNDQAVEDAQYHLTRIFQNPAPCTDAYPFAGYRVPLIFEAKAGPTWHDIH